MSDCRLAAACGVDGARRALSTIFVLGVISALGLAPLPLLAQAADQNAQQVFDVQAGDTFSAVAARVLGRASAWRQLYDPQRSGLADPNRVFPGDRLELVTRADGGRYLRLAGPRASAAVTAAPSPATPAMPTTAAATATAATTPTGAPPEASRPTAAATSAITIGVLPNIAATALLAQYEHLKRYLERTTGRTVTIATAANFGAFYNATLQGEYDIAVTASHFARVAQLDRGLVPLVVFEPTIKALLVTAAERPVKSVPALRGQNIAFANPQSLVAMYGYQWLAAQGLQQERDYRVRTTRSDAGVGQLLLGGEASAAVMSNGEFRQVPAELRQRLEVMTEFAQIPNFVVLAHPRLGSEQIATLRGRLTGFMADDDGGKFREATGVSAMQEARESQLKELDAYVPETRRLMGVAR